MKITKEEFASWTLELTENCFISIINEWNQVFGKWNWYEMTIVNISFEWDMKITGGYEFTVILLGLGIRFRHNLKFLESEVGQRLQDLKDENKLG